MSNSRSKMMELIGYKENELISTNIGLIDVFAVGVDVFSDDETEHVSYGFLHNGAVQCDTVEEFIGKFGKTMEDWERINDSNS